MPIGMLIVYPFFSLGFSWLVFKAGQAMWQMQSVKAAIEKFEANPSQGTVVEKYFYGWAFPFNRTIMKGLSNGGGDKLITLWYKGTGVIFMIFALFFVLSTAFMLYANLTGL